MSSVVNKETICNICGKEFDFPYLLERHKQNKKTCRIKSTEFECLHCCLCYANKYTLKKHMNKCKENKNANEDRNTTDTNTIMKALFINFIEQLKGCNASNELLDTLTNLIPNINNTTTNNNTTQNTINNNTDSHNITNNDNSINTTINNNTINNNTNINIEKLVIYPFGYENIDFLSDAECLRILKTTKNIIPILEKIYSLPHNHNFIKNNANKDVITVLESV